MPLKIFFCYAHEDELLLNKLKTHLMPLLRKGIIDVWYDRNISAGTEWEQQIKEQLNTAQIILLLVSPDFMNSDYCYGKEMQRALERHERGEASVIPIILRPVYWQEVLGSLQALPTDAKPIMSSSWQYQDEAFLNVTEGIRKVVEETKSSPPLPIHPTQLVSSKEERASDLNLNIDQGTSDFLKVPTAMHDVEVEELDDGNEDIPKHHLPPHALTEPVQNRPSNSRYQPLKQPMQWLQYSQNAVLTTNLNYREAGVDEAAEQEALKKMLFWFKKTFTFRKSIGSPAFSIGHFANVLDLGAGLGIVITTDGVGTKLLIAESLNKYDTVGIDCVANNVNDLLCLGAEPIAMLDYIGIDTIDEYVLEDIAQGLYKGAERAHISIPGGKIAQVKDMLAYSTNVALDLVGSAFGVVSLSPERRDLLPLVDGKKASPGDVVIGLLSSGLHSNGYSLAHKVLLDTANLKLDQYVDELGRTLGEELLEPTHIYVEPVLSLLRKGLPIHGMVNVSGGGLLNLGRLQNNYSYIIDNLPDLPPIFKLIQDYGSISEPEMFTTFNMGIGFCLVCEKTAVRKVMEDISSNEYEAIVLGEVIAESGKRIFIEPHHLIGYGEKFIEQYSWTCK